ncbi:MAG: cysteine desulfurase [Methylococcaceae bacterium]|nr:MAG: cysteine desulfurase [Methylococcaceae bacterium]
MPIKTPIYLDTASTTPVDSFVVSKMMTFLGVEGCYANPSSTAHRLGQEAASAIEAARKGVAAEFRCKSDEIIFTSGATEANNMALLGIARAYSSRGRHIVTSAIEHKSVLECCHALEREGFEVTYLTPNSAGWIDAESVKQVLRSDTLMVSLMHTNNETGVQQPIPVIAEILTEVGVLFHVDAAQAAGKFLLDLDEIPIDMLSVSAHKFHGPKGAGCLIVRNRRRLHLQPLIYGGGQEFNLRSGTLATHQIVGFSEALRIAANNRENDLAHVTKLKQLFLTQLRSKLSVQVNGEIEHSSPYIVNISLAGISSDALINQLLNEIAISSGSACSSGAIEPSYVLRAMGIEGDVLYGAVRISFSRHHSMTEITQAAMSIIAAVHRIQALSK